VGKANTSTKVQVVSSNGKLLGTHYSRRMQVETFDHTLTPPVNVIKQSKQQILTNQHYNLKNSSYTKND